MEEKIRRIVRWFKGRKQPPYTLDINPTDACNLRCVFCWKSNPKFKNLDPSSYELEDKIILKFVEEGIKFGIKEFEITGGGEPLLRRELVKKICWLIKQGKRFGNLTTNGTLFDESLAKFLVKIKWDRVTISLEAPFKSINDELRRGGSFDRVKKSLEIFRNLKKKMKSKKPKLKFNCVVNRKNLHVLDKLVEFAKAYGVEIIHFDKLTVHTKEGRNLRLRKQDLKFLENIAKKVDELGKKLGVRTDLSNLLKADFFPFSNKMDKLIKNSGSVLCYEPWWHLVIKVDGSAQPCCIFDEKEENVKEKSLKEIWFGEYFEKIRKSILEGKLWSYCKICNAGQVIENWKIRDEIAKYGRNS